MNFAALLALWVFASLLMTPLIGWFIWSALNAQREPFSAGSAAHVVIPFARRQG
jgi:hypothetical protein